MVLQSLSFIWKSLSFIYQSLSFIYWKGWCEDVEGRAVEAVRSLALVAPDAVAAVALLLSVVLLTWLLRTRFLGGD